MVYNWKIKCQDVSASVYSNDMIVTIDGVDADDMVEAVFDKVDKDEIVSKLFEYLSPDEFLETLDIETIGDYIRFHIDKDEYIGYINGN